MSDPKSSASSLLDNSMAAEVNSLSLISKFICLVIVPLAVAALATTSPLTACLLPVLCSPTILLVRRWRALEKNQKVNLDLLVKVYFGIGTIGVAIVMVLQLMCCYALALLLFGPETQVYLDEFKRQSSTDSENGVHTGVTPLSRELTSRPRYYVFLLGFCFIGAALFEEVLKYAVLVLVQKYHPQQMKQPIQYFTVAMAAGFGFATIEMVGFVYEAVERGEQSIRLAVIICERIGYGATLHAMAALITAIQLVGKDLPGQKIELLKATWRSTALHGVGNFGLFMVSALQGVVGWRHPWDPIGLLSVYCIAATVLYSTWTVLRREIRKHGMRVG